MNLHKKETALIMIVVVLSIAIGVLGAFVIAHAYVIGHAICTGYCAQPQWIPFPVPPQ